MRIWLLLLLLLIPSIAPSFSVLTHEAIIDAAWDDSIKPVLLKRFPQATPDDLVNAHAYAYGGCIIQDLGYYPFGSHQFSDLAHYVRSGSFVMNLLKDAKDVNEFAFALGALAHYAADNQGHPIATNPSVGLLFPKLRQEFGPTVTYEDDPTAHIRTEFSFDVVQVARGHYASKAYHDFIGFQVSKELLDRAFQETYGIEMKDVFHSEDTSLNTYRHTVGALIPEMTRVAWAIKKKDLQKQTPGLGRRKFVYNLSRSSYEKEWGAGYQKPSLKERFVAFLLRIVPKIGPFKALAFKAPTPQTEALFMKSFNTTLDQYRQLLRATAQDQLALADSNFDTGKPVVAGTYRLADEAYAKLVDDLEKNKFAGMQPDLRDNVLGFYHDVKTPTDLKRSPQDWEKLQRELQELRDAPAAAPQPATK
ncbi:MAG TPA: hypothetical protein DEQ47_07210 [Solibacterales bacterium]|nr:hypothetical protein [Bryobacterales bacterium]